MPISSVSTTTTAANTTVIRSASQNSPSVRMFVKLAKPTHWAGTAPETCASPKFWKDRRPTWMVGHSRTSPIPISEGSSRR